VDFGADVTPPSLASATVAGTLLTLVFNEPVKHGASYSDSHLNIDATTTGTNLALTYVSGNNTTSHVYTVASPIVAGETVDFDFTGVANSLEDGTGNDLAAITSASVTNITSSGPTFFYPPLGDVSAGSGQNVTPDNAALFKIVLPTSGTVTKLGLFTQFVNASTPMKISLFNASRVPVGSLVTTTLASGDFQWHDYTTSIAVTAGTYYVGYSSNGTFSGSVQLSFATGGVSGDAYSSTDAGSYANFPGSLTGLTAATGAHAVRLELTP
jgi:hypothetical protein